MPRAVDTTLRHLATLAAIPVSPDRRSTRDILEVLRGENPDFEVDIRTIQRSLNELSLRFPIVAERQGNRQYWYWMTPDEWLQVPEMSESAAFMLRLAEEYLWPVMPPQSLRVLEPYFRKARDVLAGTTLGRWSNRVAIIAAGPPLTPPDVPDAVWEAVSGALIRRQRIRAQYRGKHEAEAREMLINPLGIVVRAGLTYLVATAWDYEDARHYVLHRMSDAEVVPEKAEEPPGFRLRDHLSDDGSFAYPGGEERIALRALFSQGAGAHLTESRLAGGHRATPQQDGRILVEATVADTAELRWWLAGFGSGVEVLGPEALREEFREEARRLAGVYESDP